MDDGKLKVVNSCTSTNESVECSYGGLFDVYNDSRSRSSLDNRTLSEVDFNHVVLKAVV